MAIPSTAISVAALQLRQLLASEIDGLQQNQIAIDYPKHGAEQVDKTEQGLNLFFYRIERGAYAPDATQEDPFFIRLHILITALGVDQTTNHGANSLTISAGENDLRLIGEVIRLVHQHPTMLLKDGDTPVADAQMILHSLSLDDVNRLWSTQGDFPYRLSVPIEISLIPLPLAERVERSKKVGVTGLDVQVKASAGRQAPFSESGMLFRPMVTMPMSVDVTKADWQPQLLFLHEGGLYYTLHFEQNQLPTELTVVIIGQQGEVLSLVWHAWSATAGWNEVDAQPPQSVTAEVPFVDPDHLDALLGITVVLPSTDVGQLELFAIRKWTPPGETAPRSLRSNPLLITISNGL